MVREPRGAVIDNTTTGGGKGREVEAGSTTATLEEKK